LTVSLVCVVGPPGAGKTTLASALIKQGGAAAFRLREAVRRLRIGDPGATKDPLGWISDETVDRVLEIEAGTGVFASAPPLVVLDNFPGNARQLHHLHARIAHPGTQFTVLELVAPDAVIARRVQDRRVCHRCGPDPHAPALVAPGSGRRCAGCGGPLARRKSDEAHRHALRVARYRANAEAIAAAAAALHLPHRRIDASKSAMQVARVALSTCLNIPLGEVTTSPMS
jgi:adenylate kinase family enzyme